MVSPSHSQQRRKKALRALWMLIGAAVVIRLIVFAASPREPAPSVSLRPPLQVPVATDSPSHTPMSKAARKRSAQAAGASESDLIRLERADEKPEQPAVRSKAPVADPHEPGDPQAAIDRLKRSMNLPGLTGLPSHLPIDAPSGATLSAQVKELTTIRDGGELTFLGIVENTGPAALERPLVTIALWDTHRTKQLGSVTGPVDRAVLASGSRTFFKLMARKLPSFASLSASVSLRPCQADCTHGTLTLVSHKLVMRPPLATLHGQVRNDDQRTLHFVKVIALVRNKQGLPRQQGYSFTSSSSLRPGQSEPFSMTFALSTKPATIDFDLEGTVPDSIDTAPVPTTDAQPE